MPLYMLRCTACPARLHVFHHMAEPHPACPDCGNATDVDFQAQGAPSVPATDLHGSRQTLQDTHAQPREVQKLRRMYGERVGACWQDDGSVKVNSPTEARAFYTKDMEIRARFRDLKAAGKLKTRKKPIRDRAGNRLDTPVARAVPKR